MAGQPTFALLHGGGQGGWVWDETAGVLKAMGARVLVLDVPGCGTKRDRQTLELTLEDVADELITDIAAAGFAGATLVGHSQAGTLLPVMWRRSKGEIAKLYYVSACAPLHGQNIVEMLGQGVHGEHPDEVGWPLDPKTHDRLVVRRLAFCNDMDQAQADAFMARLVSDQWPPLVTFAIHWHYGDLTSACSTYILCERDNILLPDWQNRFAARLRCDRILHIDAGHQAMTTQPEALAGLLIANA
jgi:pimeloyl-ACP methyl ester carboxylesterase